MTHYLTGHSESNLRHEKGFGRIDDIIDDVRENIPQYNLIAVKAYLEELLDEVERRIDKQQ